MADEFKTLVAEFQNYGKNYCANAKKVITDLEVRKVADIYEHGLTAAMNGMGTLLNQQYDALPDEQKRAADQLVGMSGGIQMLKRANELVGPNSLATGQAVAAAVNLFPKIKKILRLILKIEAGGWLDTILNIIDEIADNIPKLLGGFAGAGTTTTAR